MKKLKKFAALLLVGVMALALLTACGGGGSGDDAFRSSLYCVS